MERISCTDDEDDLLELYAAVIQVTPVTEVKQSAKVVALNNRVDTTEFTDDSEKTVIVEITNITELDGKEIARKTTKRVVKNVTITHFSELRLQRIGRVRP